MLFLLLVITGISDTAHFWLTQQRFRELSFSRLECKCPGEDVCLRDSGKSSTAAGPCDLETWATNKVQENKLDVADAMMCESHKTWPQGGTMKYVFKYSAVSKPLGRSNRFTLHPRQTSTFRH